VGLQQAALGASEKAGPLAFLAFIAITRIGDFRRIAPGHRISIVFGRDSDFRSCAVPVGFLWNADHELACPDYSFWLDSWRKPVNSIRNKIGFGCYGDC
jgi:hypothetical protein